MSLHVQKPDGSGPACDPPLAVRAHAKCVDFKDRGAVTCPDCLKAIAFSKAALQGRITTVEAEPLPEPVEEAEDERTPYPSNIIKFPG